MSRDPVMRRPDLGDLPNDGRGYRTGRVPDAAEGRGMVSEVLKPGARLVVLQASSAEKRTLYVQPTERPSLNAAFAITLTLSLGMQGAEGVTAIGVPPQGVAVAVPAGMAVASLVAGSTNTAEAAFNIVSVPGLPVESHVSERHVLAAGEKYVVVPPSWARSAVVTSSVGTASVGLAGLATIALAAGQSTVIDSLPVWEIFGGVAGCVAVIVWTLYS